MAGTPEDKATADYVAQKFRAAGLDTEIVEYKVWFNYPLEISVDITAPAGVKMHGPTREHVEGGRPERALRVMFNLDDEEQAARFAAVAASETATYRELVDALGPNFEGGYFLYRFSDPTYVDWPG